MKSVFVVDERGAGACLGNHIRKDLLPHATGAINMIDKLVSIEVVSKRTLLTIFLFLWALTDSGIAEWN